VSKDPSTLQDNNVFAMCPFNTPTLSTHDAVINMVRFVTIMPSITHSNEMRMGCQKKS